MTRVISGAFLSLFLLLGTVYVLAQDVHYNKVIPGDTTHDKNILNRLIFLSWQNNPDNNQHVSNAEASRFFAQRTSKSWLNQVIVSGSINEYHIFGNKQYPQQYLPLYNFGLAVPLGIFFTAPNDTRQAKASYRESLDHLNIAKLDTRQKVTTAWEELKMYRRLLTIQQQINEIGYTDFLADEKKFKDGKISLKDYNTTLNRYSELLMAKIALDRNVRVSRANLERLIGISLDQVISSAAIDRAEN